MRVSAFDEPLFGVLEKLDKLDRNRKRTWRRYLAELKQATRTRAAIFVPLFALVLSFSATMEETKEERFPEKETHLSEAGEREILPEKFPS